MSRWWLWWFCIFGPGSFIRLWGLSAQSLWYDEAFTALVAALPWPRLLAATAGDVHPPLWYVLEKLIVLVLGNSEVALRLPSAIFGVFNIWLIRKVGERLGFSQPVVVLASAIMAFAPFQIYYSQEARMYELLQALILLAAWAILERHWIVLGAIWAVMLYTHNLAVLYIAILSVSYQHRRDLVGVLYAEVLAFLAYVPWMPMLLNQMGDVGDGFWVPNLSIGSFLYVFYQLFFHIIILPSWAELHGASFLYILLILAIWRGIADRLWLVLAWALLPIGLAAIVSLAWKPIYLHRTLIGAAPFLYLLVAHGLAQLSPRRLTLAGGTLAVLAIIGLGRYYWCPNDIRPGDASYTGVIREQRQAGDVLFHMNLSSYILYGYYLPDLPAYLWPQANDLSQSLTNETKSAMGIHQAEIWDIPTNASRIWLIWVDNPHISQAEVRAAGAALAWGRSPRLVETIRDDELVTAKVWLLEAKVKWERTKKHYCPGKLK